MICTDCKFSGEPNGTRTCPHCFGKMTTSAEQATVVAKALWADWVSSWFTIGMAHWLSISKQLPPKWAAIAMGYDEHPGNPDSDLFYQRIREHQIEVLARRRRAK